MIFRSSRICPITFDHYTCTPEEPFGACCEGLASAFALDSSTDLGRLYSGSDAIRICRLAGHRHKDVRETHSRKNEEKGTKTQRGVGAKLGGACVYRVLFDVGQNEGAPLLQQQLSLAQRLRARGWRGRCCQGAARTDKNEQADCNRQQPGAAHLPPQTKKRKVQSRTR